VQQGLAGDRRVGNKRNQMGGALGWCGLGLMLISQANAMLNAVKIKCVWLACGGGGSGARSSDWTAAIAGKPAPTGDLTGEENVGTTTDQVWERA
jgi:hypothetical protein